MYIDYTYFTNNGGNNIAAAAFPPLEYRARMILDRLTQQRITKMAEVPEAVQRLMVELINVESFEAARLTEPTITSFSNDGYSESYAQVTPEMTEQHKMKLIHAYLSGATDDNGTPLLWLGVEK